jgi:hypothetical protein
MDRGGTGWIIFILAGVISLVFLISALVGAARAHDHNRPELDGWFRSLHSKGGAWCCNGDDAEEAEWDTAGGKYRVRIDGQWIDVPDEAIVEGPNRVGGARVWSMHQDGKPAVRCFLPGSLI